jgi:hypothetical protein
MNRSWILPSGLAAAVLIAACCVFLFFLAGVGFFVISDRGRSAPTEASTPVVIRPSPPAATETGGPPTAATEGPPATAPAVEAVLGGPDETLETLRNTTIPENDPLDLARRLKGIGQEDLILTEAPPAQPRVLGEQQAFWVSNSSTNQRFQVQATLHFITDHSYFWIQDGVRFDEGELRSLALAFEEQIYPTNRAFFGSEWTPGIDGDPRLYILYARNLGRSIAGYFSSIDSYPQQIQEFSNEHEMFVFNADTTGLGEGFTYGVLAHEDQHMIHWYQDRNESTWLNEGFSDLAILLNDYSVGTSDDIFAANPDVQLNDWPTEEEDTTPHYGAAFFFVTYFLDRFGDEATRALSSDAENGLESVDQVLNEIGANDPLMEGELPADELFIDWAITNYLHDDSVAGGRYAYHNYPAAPRVALAESLDTCPLELSTREVSQYGTDYIHIDCEGDYTLSFEGSIQTGVVPTEPHSGSFAFWSNKGDESHMTLTQTFDFTGNSGPLTLTYWTWYDLEKDYDYLYLTASTDGEQWEILTTPSGTDEDLTGANYGWGYNGASGGGEQAEWIEERIDLSQFAGQEVQIRFEYITDAGVNGEGFLLDDIAIPETGYASDFESDNGGWQAAGFVRIQNALPQTFRLALITQGETTQVQHIALSPDNAAEVPLKFGEGVEQAVLVVTGTTRYTRLPAAYQFRIVP